VLEVSERFRPCSRRRLQPKLCHVVRIMRLLEDLLAEAMLSSQIRNGMTLPLLRHDDGEVRERSPREARVAVSFQWLKLVASTPGSDAGVFSATQTSPFPFPPWRAIAPNTPNRGILCSPNPRLALGTNSPCLSLKF